MFIQSIFSFLPSSLSQFSELAAKIAEFNVNIPAKILVLTQRKRARELNKNRHLPIKKVSIL